jgi:hypothetical protein
MYLPVKGVTGTDPKPVNSMPITFHQFRGLRWNTSTGKLTMDPNTAQASRLFNFQVGLPPAEEELSIETPVEVECQDIAHDGKRSYIVSIDNLIVLHVPSTLGASSTCRCPRGSICAIDACGGHKGRSADEGKGKVYKGLAERRIACVVPKQAALANLLESSRITSSAETTSPEVQRSSMTRLSVIPAAVSKAIPDLGDPDQDACPVVRGFVCVPPWVPKQP